MFPLRALVFCLSVLLTACSPAQQADIWITTGDQTKLLDKQTPAEFRPWRDPALPVVIVADSIAYQTIEGFGASMTDSAAYLIHRRVPAELQQSVMEELFDPEKGIGLSFLRNPMGASDLARFHYSYNELPPGEEDPKMERFSIGHDRADILPLLRLALRINPRIRMMGSPWSAPGWMKTSGSMIGGSLRREAYPAYALYFRRYIEAYAAEGVPVHYISVQNEPLYVPRDYPGMSMTAAEQTEFLRDHLIPTLEQARLPVRILVYDHNWDRPDYPLAVLSDPVLSRSPLIAGTAWHWYGGTAGAMSVVHQADPQRGQYVTEASGGTWIQDQVKADFEAIIHSMRNWARAFVKWGLALNERRGPNAGGCNTCTGLIEVNESTGVVRKTVDYYTLGHFSRFVRPGAVRVYSTNIPGVITRGLRQPRPEPRACRLQRDGAAAAFPGGVARAVAAGGAASAGRRDPCLAPRDPAAAGAGARPQVPRIASRLRDTGDGADSRLELHEPSPPAHRALHGRGQRLSSRIFGSRQLGRLPQRGLRRRRELRRGACGQCRYGRRARTAA